MKLIALLLLLLTISSTQQACAAGCLKCDPNGSCVVPDLSTGFVLSSNTAVQSTLTNCLVLNPDGTCASCNAGFFLDATTSKCVAVPSASLITNCRFYSTATSCSLCAAGFYLNNNACTAVTTTVANCAAYSSATVCAACSTGYILSLDSTSCVSVSSVQNCSGYTYVTCANCATGYHLNRNAYLANNLQVGTAAQNSTLAVFTRNIIQGTAYIGTAACASSASSNCATFTVDTNTCTACNSGYFLDTKGVCNAFPAEPIPNCSIYSNSSTCSTCANGYTLSNNACTAIVAANLVANCATYDGTSSSVTCTACSSNYYLSGSNTCTIRVASLNLANCATFTVNQDTCTTCATGYILSTEGQQCYAAIANCATHSPVAKSSTIQCQTCNDTFILTAASAGNQSTCTAGSISNCAQYSNATTCSSCVNGYYLVNSSGVTTCSQQPTITNCSVFSQTAGQCTTCNPANSFLVSQSTSCQNITGTLIPNCVTYGANLTTPVCSACATGYFLTNSNTACTAITISNCLVATANSGASACQNCAAGYYLNYNASGCVQQFATYAANCFSNNAAADGSTAIGTQTCSVCNAGSFPLAMTNQFICLSLTETAQVNSGTAFDNTTTANANACLKVNASLACVMCDPASAAPYLLLSTNSCVATCASGKVNKYTLTPGFQIQYINTCNVAGLNDNCAVYGPDVSNAGALICIQCNSTTVATKPATFKYSNVNPAATGVASANILTNFFPGLYRRFPEVTCYTVNPGTTTIGTAATSAATDRIAHCALYTLTTNDLECARCDSGYTGLVTSTGGTDVFTTCSLDSSVNYTPVLGNLDKEHVPLFNVYSCPLVANADTNVPVMVYAPTSATNPTFVSFPEYGVASGTYDLSGTGQKNIVCRSRTTALTGVTTWGFLVASSYTNYNNCGLVAVTTNGGVINASNPYANYCAACSPGYSPTNDGTYPYVKTACTQITNCATGSTIYNGCSTCAANYALLFVSGNIDFTQCVSVSANASKFANCYATSVVSGAADRCRVCNQGFVINADGICQAILPANCTTNGFVQSSTTTIATTEWSIFVAGNAPGCNRCASNYIAVDASATGLSSRAICVPGNYEQNTVDTLAAGVTTAYVQRCAQYQITLPTLTCSVCESGYVKSTSNTCLVNTNLANCLSATSATVCARCLNATFSLTQAGACVTGNLPNCLVYNWFTASTNGTTQVCSQCANGYYLNASGVCTLGSVTNCTVYASSAIRCTTCATGFTKIDNSGNGNANLGDLCIASTSPNGCSSFSISNAGAYTCNACTNNTNQAIVAVPANAATSVCLAFSPVTNCATYNVGAITSAAYTCATCSAGYYLTTRNTCAARTVINNCATYVANNDSCSACATGYFLVVGNAAVGGASCANYPNGIFKCQAYTNSTTCSVCKPGYYLSSNACVLVTTAIANCSYYSAANACSACATGYFLANNACVAVTAQNCLTYSAANTCSSCNNGFILQATTSSQTNNGVTTSVTTTNCVAASNKPNCATVDYNSPNNCLSCNTGYYLNNGACTAATAISQCAVYASATTCSRCNAGYALSTDALTCVSNANVTAYADANCANSQLVATPACSRCGPGSYFVNGACSGTCSVTGCLACSPSSNSTCYVCNSSYHQDTSGNCIANTNPVTPTSANIFGALSALVLVLVVMLK